jgi:hypothetical protein
MQQHQKILDNCFKQPLKKKKKEYHSNLPKILETIEVYE